MREGMFDQELELRSWRLDLAGGLQPCQHCYLMLLGYMYIVVNFLLRIL